MTTRCWLYVNHRTKGRNVFDSANISNQCIASIFLSSIKIRAPLFISVSSIVFILANWKETFFLLWQTSLSTWELNLIYFSPWRTLSLSNISFLLCIFNHSLKPAYGSIKSLPSKKATQELCVCPWFQDLDASWKNILYVLFQVFLWPSFFFFNCSFIVA